MSEGYTMSWKRWKRGLVIASLTGLMTGAVSFVAGGDWKVFLSVVVVCVAKDAKLWMTQHPIETVTDTTQFFHDKPKIDAGPGPTGSG
jgi:hypothetical protein